MESLAFGTLLNEGYGVRLSGQDVERGTFSHRHALISDQQKDIEKFNFYKSINPEKVTICNSHLSEYGVLGFEYGYSITNPNTLVIWEAQFGDFANGASTIIDNYLASGESKWGIQTGLVLSLPHGMDGQGPEHSSARLERFLHLSDDNCDVDLSLSHQQQLEKCNLQIVTCSTTSNYFHALRRQLRRDYRKPLITFNSKKLLKFKGVIFKIIFRQTDQFKISLKGNNSSQSLLTKLLILKKSKEC
jgi:2-oxoglutarate dehydrogenase E1 component